MSKIIEKLIVSSTAPNNPNVGWVKQKADRSKELLIHDNNSWTPIGGSNSGDGSGSGIDIVDSVDKLDPNAELGSIASVITPGSVGEVNISELSQADATIIDQTTGFINAGDCPQVSGLQIIVPTGAISVPTTFNDSSMLYFVSESLDVNGMSAGKALALGLFQQNVQTSVLSGMYMDVETATQLELELFSIVDGVVTANQEAIDQINELSNGLHYIGNLHCILNGDSIPDEVLTVYDMVVKAISGKPALADIYVKGDKWEKQYAKDFEKIASNIGKVETSITDKINAKADKMPIESYASWLGLQPNVYTTYTISSTGNDFIKLAEITDRYTYNEYIIEIKCTSTPSSVSFKSSNNAEVVINWANDNIPIFEEGYTYIISIVNNFGVFAQFPNS
jgi:hypothetical protein